MGMIMSKKECKFFNQAAVKEEKKIKRRILMGQSYEIGCCLVLKVESNWLEEKKPADEASNEMLDVKKGVMKMSLHCDICIENIVKEFIVTRRAMVLQLNREEDMVMVVGSFDFHVLAKELQERFLRHVELVDVVDLDVEVNGHWTSYRDYMQPPCGCFTFKRR